MQIGLDSWLSKEDKKMLKYYKKSVGKEVDLESDAL